MSLVREPTGKTLVFPSYRLPEGANYFEQAYYHLAASCIYFLRAWSFFQTANAAGSLMIEPSNCLYIGYQSVWGRKKAFHYHSLNPRSLTEEQKSRPAILLLHGKGSNQSVWIGLAKAFEKEKIGPVFTLNTSDGELTNEDLVLLEEKYEEIRKLYEGKSVKIILVGHSRGAEYSLYAALQPNAYSLENGFCKAMGQWTAFRPEILRVIRIGSPLLEKERKKLPLPLQNMVYEIDGLRDMLIPDRSSGEARHKFSVDCGHVSLLFHPEAHQIIFQLCLDF